jgi:hypothetical protein
MGGIIMRNKSGILIGAVLIIFGILFLLSNFNILNFSLSFGHIIGYFWATIFLIIPAIAMHSIYFSGKSRGAGLLVPAGILLVIGVVCQLSMLFNIWSLLWPGYIFSVGFGLFELYTFGGKHKGLLIPVTILTGLSLIFFAEISLKGIFGGSMGDIFVPLLIVAIGLLIIYGGGKNKRSF